MHTHALLFGPVRPAILRIALPGMAGMLASSVCSLLDALLLGRDNAQLSAAVSVSYSLLALIQTIGFTLGMGAGSFVSRSLGSGEKKAAHRAASCALFTALALSAALCAAGFLFTHPLVRLLGASAENCAPAAAYARCVLLTGPMLCASLVLSSLLRAQGHAAGNMAAFVSGAAAGASLLFLLVGRLHLGISGAGAAMLVREAVTLLVLLAAYRRAGCEVHPRLRDAAPSRRVYADIMRSGLPTLLRQGLMSLSGALLMRQSAAFGEASLAGMGLAMRALSLVSSAVIGFGQGFQPVCGASFGAGRMDRAAQAYRFCMRCVVIALLLLSLPLFLFAPALLAPFRPDAQASAFAVRVLRAQSVVLFAQGAVIMMNMLTQAMGFTLRASIIATSRQGYVLIALLLVLPRVSGETGLILCQSVSDILSLLLCFVLSRPCLDAQRIKGCACVRGGYSGARKASR